MFLASSSGLGNPHASSAPGLHESSACTSYVVSSQVGATAAQENVGRSVAIAVGAWRLPV
ncbi:MAG TPA: hypothetical protein VN903_26695 [Polyangia bacterium]|nr:hypothetical protein [Polyangia bacterium]